MKTTLIFLLATFFLSLVHAQSKSTRFNVKQLNQQKRITHGLATGDLTAREFVHLERKQRNLQKHKKQVYADCLITPRERAALKAHKSRNSAAIFRQKHDLQTR